MLNRQTITIYNNIKDNLTSQETYQKEIIKNVYVEEQSGRNLKETGLLDIYNVYLSIPYSKRYKYYKEFKLIPNYDKENYYTIEPKKTIIIIGECNLQYSDFESKSEFLENLNSYKKYIVQTVDEKFHCSRRLWHIEVGGV